MLILIIKLIGSKPNAIFSNFRNYINDTTYEIRPDYDLLIPFNFL
jgi:hypothetical protein